jgi:hypothetical protein
MKDNLPFWRQYKRMNHVISTRRKGIFVNDGYWRVKLLDMKLGKNWLLTTARYPAFFVQVKYGNNDFQYLLSPEKLISNYSGTSSRGRIHIEPHYVTPYIPLTGESAELGVALVAVPGEQIAEEMLNLLGRLATIAHQTEVTIALELTKLLHSGLQSIFRLKAPEMQLGWYGKIGENEKQSTTLVVIGEPNIANWTRENLRFRNGRLQMLDESIRDKSYLVFGISVVQRRLDWENIPSIAKALRHYKQIARLPKVEDEIYNEAVMNLVLAIESTSELVQQQKEEIIDLIPQIAKNIREQNLQIYRAPDSDHFDVSELVNRQLILRPPYRQSSDDNLFED